MGTWLRAFEIGRNLIRVLETFIAGQPVTLGVSWKGKTYTLTLTQLDNHVQL